MDGEELEGAVQGLKDRWKQRMGGHMSVHAYDTSGEVSASRGGRRRSEMG